MRPLEESLSKPPKKRTNEQNENTMFTTNKNIIQYRTPGCHHVPKTRTQTLCPIS
jgi:hypothetical protein